MRRNKLVLVLLGCAAFLLSFVLTLRSAQADERFDYMVRNDFFAGFGGDNAALERGMKKSEQAIQADPKNAEALVWHGAGLYYKGGQAFRNGDSNAGQELVMKGISEMDRAVELAPDDVGVRVPRGAVLLQSTLFMPESPFRTPLIEKGLADYERVLEIQKNGFEKLGVHPRGELLFGIAEARGRLGNDAGAREIFERIKRELPASSYSRRADQFLTAGKLQPEHALCSGCHTPSR